MPSTAIRSFSYDDQSKILFVTFIDGDLYAYRGVPADVNADFKAAPSKGRFFANTIRDRYPYAKLPDPLAGRQGGTDEAGGHWS